MNSLAQLDQPNLNTATKQQLADLVQALLRDLVKISKDIT